MIHRISSSDPRFRTIEFTAGLNLVLAVRTSTASEKDSRNGLGKSSLIDIIQFCLGSGCDKRHRLANPALRESTYSLDLDVPTGRVTASRCPAKPKEVLLTGSIDPLPFKVQKIGAERVVKVNVEDWNTYLGRVWFELEEEDAGKAWTPSYRHLMGYFVRQGKGAYNNPFEYFAKQPTWVAQTCCSHLVGLDWKYAQRWERMREQNRMVKQIRSSADSGLFPHLAGIRKQGELEARKVVLTDKASREMEGLAAFKVHPQFHVLEQEASQLTLQIHEISGQIVSDREMLAFFEASMRDDTPPPDRDVEKIYEQAGVALPGLVKKRFEEVRKFHEDIVRNRRSFLKESRDRLLIQIQDRSARLQELDEQRAKRMAVLNTHGALEEYSRLQGLHSETLQELEAVKGMLAGLRNFEKGSQDLKVEKANLEREQSRDFEAREPTLMPMLSLFNEHAQFLYESAGNLIIQPQPKTGYRFDYSFERKTSSGVDNMAIFCFDLAVSRMWAKAKSGPDFLVHDSLIFDGVDERQVARALELAAQTQAGSQYICCLNSDRIPESSFSTSFNWRKFSRLELRDDDPSGGLFGFRFSSANPTPNLATSQREPRRT
jgi:uncharacterized protein YydD (DUF2326 family)